MATRDITIRPEPDLPFFRPEALRADIAVLIRGRCERRLTSPGEAGQVSRAPVVEGAGAAGCARGYVRQGQTGLNQDHSAGFHNLGPTWDQGRGVPCHARTREAGPFLQFLNPWTNVDGRDLGVSSACRLSSAVDRGEELHTDAKWCDPRGSQGTAHPVSHVVRGRALPSEGLCA